MAREPQDQAWNRWLDRTSNELQLLSAEGRTFVRVMREQLATARGDRSDGDRQRVTTAFRKAVESVLTERGIRIDDPPARVELLTGIKKAADVSFTTGGARWVLEIKCGLEFNSLGAAVLEGILFHRREPASRFVLLSLYSKMWIEPSRLAELLTEIGLGHAFDAIAVLILNCDPEEDWWSNAAVRINELFETIPRGEQGGRDPNP